MIRFACPGCTATFTVAEEKAGKTGKCPKCQSQFVIPAADAGDGGGPAGADAPPVPLSQMPPPLPSSAVGPPPSADTPVEIRPCPKCNTRLSVLPADVGHDIQCPSCETVFKALRVDAPPPPDSGTGKGGSSSLVRLGSGSKRQDDDEDDRGDRGRRRSKWDDDEDDDRPSRRRRSRYDDDDDDYDRPRRSRQRSMKTHRGGMILAFGIIGLVLCFNVIGITFNILAIVFASQDLKEMDNGTMDPAGRGMTSAGRMCGIIGLCMLPVCICGIIGLAAMDN